jgi:hypothetical protein
MSTISDARNRLKASLSRRESTSDVAQAILGLGFLPEHSELHKKLSELAHRGSYGYYDTVYDDYDRVDPADSQLETFSELFPNINLDEALSVTVDHASYVSVHQDLITSALYSLGVPAGLSANQALRERYTLDWTNGLASSKKAFVKRVRFLNSFEEKLGRVADMVELRHAQMQAKSRLAYAVDADKLDDVSLAFVAYLAARANRRSLFMLGGQSKAFDDISDALRGMISTDANWEQIAYVSPTMNVFEHLSQDALGRLMGKFHSKMTVAARHLGALFLTLPVRMRAEMVMVKGVDSSRWNAYAGALNTMRSAWISATIAAGFDSVLDKYLPGKAPRLMAADLVWWARNMGQELHEDTRMFAKLPYPWEVINGDKKLNRAKILSVARKANVTNVDETGWVGPRTGVVSEVAAAEPITVHGIVVSDPHLAVMLRKSGAFSAKNFSPLEDLMTEVWDKQAETVGEKTYMVVS